MAFLGAMKGLTVLNTSPATKLGFGVWDFGFVSRGVAEWRSSFTAEGFVFGLQVWD